ncbi:MAG: hypothetical protein CL897_06395 [Dehalococcoidia bacterium]|nr:hypothetical protein [Dehalococcoidia bacterium]|tara:strand:+ start:120 stop:1787 length:1668 start_codon:yes stop_codon:yes gene_type:complete
MSGAHLEKESPLGVVIGGSLSDGLEVLLAPGESVQLGQFTKVEVEGGGTLLGMVTDIGSEAVDSDIPVEDLSNPLLDNVVQDKAVHTTFRLDLHLELFAGGEEPAPACSMPGHFSSVLHADQVTVGRAFATSGPSISVGIPLGLEKLEVAVDLERLFERSAAIFGKSGTGKSVLVLHLLNALLTRSSAAPTNSERTVALVFDRHNDYGQGVRQVPSLKQLHQTDVELFTLESLPSSSDGQVLIGTHDIQPRDLQTLGDSLSLSDLSIEAAYACSERFGHGWIDEIVAEEPSGVLLSKLWPLDPPAADVNWSQVAARMGFSESFESLRRSMNWLTRRKFIRGGGSHLGDVAERIVRSLQGGKSVVVQFGAFEDDHICYMLVANMLSRRIWERYRFSTQHSQKFLGLNNLVIVLEEAHKLLGRSSSGQSILGQIASEMRKYNVTLLVIDQWPSRIEPEVLSQIGTKFCLQLDSDNEVEALVGSGTGCSGLHRVIGSIGRRRQAVAFGHALPMPLVIQTPEAPNSQSDEKSFRARLGLSEREEISPAKALFGAPGSSD